MTLLCVPILVRTAQQARADALRAVEAGADVVELRLDLVDDDATLDVLLSGLDVPVILTQRPTWEGGGSTIDDDARLARLDRWLAKHSVRAVDVELKTLRPRPDYRPAAKLIASAHDFAGRPDRLGNLYLSLAARGDVAKLAWRARTVRDNIEAFELLLTAQVPTVALCMEFAGLPSRVLAKKFGAWLTFAALDEEAGTAPGQPTIEQMKRLYRWDALGRATRVYGVAGSAAASSLSPHMHNAVFDHHAFDGVYLPLPVVPSYESFKAFAESWFGFAPLDLHGVSVTVPHKENAARWLHERGGAADDTVRRVGALNTITRRDDGTLAGANTDYWAIRALVGDVRGARAAVLGAGGTARAAVAALVESGADVTVFNRTRAKGDALAADFGVASAELPPGDGFDLILNATTLGTAADATPLDPLPATPFVFDCVYAAGGTRLARDARAAGARVVDGLDLLVAQGALQSELWTGRPAPRDTMRAAAEAELARRTPL